MNKIVFIIFFFAFFTVLNTSDIFACSCSLPIGNKSTKQQVEESYKNSTAVFIGEVVEAIKKPNTYFFQVKLKVDNSWKNDLQGEIILITGQSSGDCGFPFQIGEKYLVYAYGAKDRLGTNICTRTSVFESNEDVAFLNKIKKIKKSKIKSSPK